MTNLSETNNSTPTIDELKTTAIKGIKEANGVKEIRSYMQAGGNIDKKDVKGMTLLHNCAYYGSKGGVQECLKYKASINTQDKNGFTPLAYAARNGHVEIVELLLLKKANENITTYDGKTPLILALEKGRLPVIALFEKRFTNARRQARLQAAFAKKESSPLKTNPKNNSIDR